MYKGASENQQHAARPKRLKDLIRSGEEGLTNADRIDALRRRIKQIDAEIQAATTKDERRRLGQLKYELQEKRRALGYRRVKQDIAHHFVTAVKQMVPKGQFEAYLNAARALAAQEEQELKV